jgi:hypothetical protein
VPGNTGSQGKEKRMMIIAVATLILTLPGAVLAIIEIVRIIRNR